MLDIPTKSGTTPRQEYLKSQEYGLPTPLDNIKEKPKRADYIYQHYIHLAQFKTKADEKLSLQDLINYQTIFNIKIHPFVASQVLIIDSRITNKILDEYQKRNSE